MNEHFDNLEAVLKRVNETADFSGRPAENVMSRGFFGTTPLHVVAVWGSVEAGRLLLAAGADPNVMAEHGYTPLHEAVEQGHKAFVELLLANGASPQIKNDDGQTPLALADVLEDNEVRQLIEKAGGSRN